MPALRLWVICGLALLCAGVASGAETYFIAFGKSIHRFSSTGEDLGPYVTTQLPEPEFAVVDQAGNLYVLEFEVYHGLVEKFSPTGTPLGTIIDGLKEPWGGLAISPAGDLYLGAMNGSKPTLGRYSTAGKYLDENPDIDLLRNPATPTTPPLITTPTSVAFDRRGNLYLSYMTMSGEFSAGGTGNLTFKSTLMRTAPNGKRETLVPLSDGINLQVDFDLDDNLWVKTLHRSSNELTIGKYTPSGKQFAQWTISIPQPTAPGEQFFHVKADGNLLYFAGVDIHKYSPTGAYLGVFAKLPEKARVLGVGDMERTELVPERWYPRLPAIFVVLLALISGLIVSARSRSTRR